MKLFFSSINFKIVLSVNILRDEDHSMFLPNLLKYLYSLLSEPR